MNNKLTRSERIAYGKEINEMLERHGITYEEFMSVAKELREIDKRYGLKSARLVEEEETDE